jgi:hypothetical protein
MYKNEALIENIKALKLGRLGYSKCIGNKNLAHAHKSCLGNFFNS